LWRPSAAAESASPRQSCASKRVVHVGENGNKNVSVARAARNLSGCGGQAQRRLGDTGCAPTFEPSVGVAHFDTSVACLERTVLHLSQRVLHAEGVGPPTRAMCYPQQIATKCHLREGYS
jgi:hypothetical protein